DAGSGWASYSEPAIPRPRAESAMIRLRDVSLRTKLFALVIGYTVLVATVLLLAGYVIHRYRVSGPVYDQIVDNKQLLADSSPATLNQGATYLMLQELDSLSDPGEIRETIERYHEYEAKFFEKRSHWLGKVTDPELRRFIEVTIYLPAAEMIRVANEEF